MEIQKRKEEVRKEGEQPKKALFSFVICYNCRGKGYTMKSCTSASRAVFKKIERKTVLVDKGKKQMKIINDDSFIKVANIHSTPSPTPGPALKTPIPKARIVELRSHWDRVEAAKTKVIVERAEQDEWKINGPLTGLS